MLSPAIEEGVKVKELRELVHWSEGHIWCAPELHGGLCGTFKNQIDWIPLDTGGRQSFDAMPYLE